MDLVEAERWLMDIRRRIEELKQLEKDAEAMVKRLQKIPTLF